MKTRNTPGDSQILLRGNIFVAGGKILLQTVPGANEAGSDHGRSWATCGTRQVILDIHTGLDIRHELDHHNVGHRVVKLFQRQVNRKYFIVYKGKVLTLSVPQST